MSATRMSPSVSVPVFSVHITVTAPIVSPACIRRTSVPVESMRRMLRASDSDTAMGKPSGTAITMSVTAIMKLLRSVLAISIQKFGEE